MPCGKFPSIHIDPERSHIAIDPGGKTLNGESETGSRKSEQRGPALQWRMPEIPHQQKITFGEMRAAGVAFLLNLCAPRPDICLRTPQVLKPIPTRKPRFPQVGLSLSDASNPLAERILRGDTQ
jgi:hypothetical protein